MKKRGRKMTALSTSLYLKERGNLYHAKLKPLNKSRTKILFKHP